MASEHEQEHDHVQEQDQDQEQQVASGPASVTPGQLLRAAREEKQWTTHQVAAMLRLRVSLVEQLEADNYDKIEPTAYVRGYLRMLCKVLELDEGQLMAAYQQMGFAEVAPAAINMKSFSKRKTRERNDHRLMLISYAVIGVVIAMAVIWWWQDMQAEGLFGGEDADARSTVVVETVTQPAPVVAPPVESIIDDAILLSSNDILQSALMVRPEISAAQYRLESSLTEVKIAKSSLYPTLSFGANMGTGYYNMGGGVNDRFSNQIKNNMSNSLGFNLQIPIFNKFQTRSSIKTAQLTAENNRIEIDKVRIELRKRVEQAYQNALGAHSKWMAAQKAEAAGIESFRFSQEKFDNGRANSFELFQAKSNLTKTLADKAQAKFEYAFRLKILELLKD